MNGFMHQIHRTVAQFAREEEGAQVVEYALIIAVVSIALAIALQGLTGLPFSDFVARIASCLSGSCS